MELSRIDYIGLNGNEGLHYNAVFIVTMHSIESNDSYVLGAYSCIPYANDAGMVEENWRMGKYRPSIVQTLIDNPMPDEKLANSYAMEVTRAEANIS